MKKVKREGPIAYSLLLLIILIGLFFRTYKLTELYSFAHDNDLYSWIVKDILVDKHIRLIGQETSVPGIYIGPLFYYLLVPFFALFKMDPVGATVPITILGVFTIFSFYWVVSKYYGKSAGLVAAFLYAVALPGVFFDRWVVPTQPTILWSIWYLYTLLSLIEGDFQVLPLVGILFGLVWHIHIALAPLALLLPVSLILSKKKVSFKNFVLPLFLAMVLTSSFWLFELRYNFPQIRGVLSSFSRAADPAQGFYRLQKVFDQASSYLLANLFYNFKFNNFLNVVPFLLLVGYSLKSKITARKSLLIFCGWVAIVLLSQFISRRTMSEYYFANLTAVTLTFLAVFLGRIVSCRWGKFVLIPLFVLFLGFNFNQLTKTVNLPDGYLEKKNLVEYLKKDAQSKNYPCVSINYITWAGNSVGFRYFFWKNGLEVIQPGKGAPVYNIVIPASISENEVKKSFGIMGVIPPEIKEFDDVEICQAPSNQLLPLLGFVK